MAAQLVARLHDAPRRANRVLFNTHTTPRLHGVALYASRILFPPSRGCSSSVLHNAPLAARLQRRSSNVNHVEGARLLLVQLLQSVVGNRETVDAIRGAEFEQRTDHLEERKMHTRGAEFE